MDYDFLKSLRTTHPAWRLLAADSAAFVISFLYKSFVQPNIRALSEQDISTRLDDYLYRLRAEQGSDAFRRSAREYLNDWSDNKQGWLRRHYPPNSDEAHLDLTPAAERAIQWLASLEEREFIGAESRLKLVFDLLHEIADGSETDPNVRLAELVRRRALLDAEIDRVRAGRMALMDPTQLRERFLQAVDTARALLADFRQVEQNFRNLDRQVRERITASEEGKGEVLQAVFGEHDAIVDSDQGRSFRAFWEFLMSPARQQELTELLEQVLTLDAVSTLEPDPRLKRVHYDWLNAGEFTLRTVARLSEQLRRYLDDQAWFENRRIMVVLRELESHALAVRDAPPTGPMTALEDVSPTVELPMERPLFAPPLKPIISHQLLDEGGDGVPADSLFDQFYVDKDRLRARLHRALQTRRQVSLVELLESEPLQQGLAELVAWLTLATGEARGLIDDSRIDTIAWTDDAGRPRQATMPTVIFIADAERTSPVVANHRTPHR